MLNESQKLERATGLGGSDAAPALGLSPWKSPFRLYQEKRGEAPDEQEVSEPMRWGSLLEPLVLAEYERRTGREVIAPRTMLRHPKHGFMVANIDGIAQKRGIEAKTARTADGWGEQGTDEVPRHYLFQCQHYIAVAALEVMDVAVLVGGQDFRLYEIPRDDELIDMIIEGESGFWGRVERGEPPDPITVEEANERYRTSRQAQVTATVEVLQALKDLTAWKDAIENGEAERDARALIVKKFMGEADALLRADGHLLATWKSAKDSQKFDRERFKEAHPGVYEQFLKTEPGSRRFLLKE